MNMGIVTSFVVGGLLLISMLTLSYRMSQYGSSSTIDMVTKNQIETITELLENDFRKIGQDLPGSVQPFVIMQDQRIKFRADTYFGDNRPFSMITWTFNDNKEYSASTNPNDFELTRQDNSTTGPGNSTLIFPVTFFEVTYMDQSGNPVTNLPSNQSLIRQIQIDIILESQEPSGTNAQGENQYARTVWSKTFYPPNLQFSNQ